MAAADADSLPHIAILKTPLTLLQFRGALPDQMAREQEMLVQIGMSEVDAVILAVEFG